MRWAGLLKAATSSRWNTSTARRFAIVLVAVPCRDARPWTSRSQVASALTVAHAAGVVHRDLKPENVMLRPDGIVKVLDFGLAKLVASDPGGETPTQTLLHTEPGKIVGTVAYMSPEQARGVAVDARTDVWALGVLLYEMLSGQRPFSGASSTDVLAAILDHEPSPLTRFDPDTPAELTRIVGKALRKDPDQRYQVMKDLLLDLQALRDELASSPGGAGCARQRRQVSSRSTATAGGGGTVRSRSRLASGL